MNEQEEIQKLINNIKKLEKGEKLDLSSGEDLSIAIMNLISIEEHLFFTAGKTNDSQYLDILNKVREMRKELLKKIIKNPDGEVWCISKHLLSASMRLMEVGTKSLGKGDKEEAKELFKKSYELYNLFWGLNLDLVKTSDIKVEENNDVQYVSEEQNPKIKAGGSVFDKLGQIIKKAVDCCKE
ncbi:hypothetical protein GYA37_02155 [candidate division WWE3 bacterium]|uniref:Uncharacterized protein n=1 Tax=candidate division WWE3 bacterium TaxID=2053526 RepID=A0A7X9E7B4_UNCKA|nr:hypothetical protein [candidate division WWE3 bacterium]